MRIGGASSRAFNLGKDQAAGGFHSSEISPRRSRFGDLGITTIPGIGDEKSPPVAFQVEADLVAFREYTRSCR